MSTTENPVRSAIIIDSSNQTIQINHPEYERLDEYLKRKEKEALAKGIYFGDIRSGVDSDEDKNVTSRD